MTKKLFDQARQLYFGTKRGLDVEYANFIYHSTHPVKGNPKYNVNKVAPLLAPAIELQIAQREYQRKITEFVPSPKNFQTWINNHCWTEVCLIPVKKKVEKVESRMPRCVVDGTEARDYKLNNQNKPVFLCSKCKQAWRDNYGDENWGRIPLDELKRILTDTKLSVGEVERDLKF